MLPLLGAVLVVLLVAIPSFWSFEPSASDEGVGLPAAVLFAAGTAWMVFRCTRIFNSWRKVSKFIGLASPSLGPSDPLSELEAYELQGTGPNLFVAGVWRPKLLISSAAVELLDPHEMQAAIRHEFAHVRRRDNLKQVLVRFCAFPCFASLDRKWLQAAEMAADDQAATDELGAAELASALIKVGKASARMAVPELGMSLVPEDDAPVSERVQRLLDWKPVQSHRGEQMTQLCLLLLPVGIVAINLVWLMTEMHRFTEVLFR
jgi:Zn-dependent protease with chaperone function